jgi:hypothetical protein
MIKFKPEYLNDTLRKYPRTLAEAFPTAPALAKMNPHCRTGYSCTCVPLLRGS